MDKKSSISRELLIYIITMRSVIRDTLSLSRETRKEKELYREIMQRENLLSENQEYVPYLSYMKKTKRISVFNSSFEEKYALLDPEIYYDKERNLKYIIHNNKRLYYPRNTRNTLIVMMYRSICCEQDKQSPHRYYNENERFDGTTVIDCGSAEGNFPLEIIDQLKAVHLIEGDKKWIKPLNATFAPWKDKVKIINRFIGNGENEISLRHYLQSLVEKGELDYKDDLFIKLDIEGYEPNAMEDIASIISKYENIRIAVCVYHNTFDEEKIRKVIPDCFSVYLRPGYMLFYFGENKVAFPYFRHGLMRIEKSSV